MVEPFWIPKHLKFSVPLIPLSLPLLLSIICSYLFNYKYCQLVTAISNSTITLQELTMHHMSKLVLSLLLAIAILSTTTAATRNNVHLKLHPDVTKYAASLQSRLQLNKGGGLVDCWNALAELKSCTSEIVLFFLNGESYLTIECCHAIRTITFQCWPSMLSTVGFTAEEADILRGYCDAEVGSGAPVTGAPPSQSPAPAPIVPAWERCVM